MGKFRDASDEVSAGSEAVNRTVKRRLSHFEERTDRASLKLALPERKEVGGGDGRASERGGGEEERETGRERERCRGREGGKEGKEEKCRKLRLNLHKHDDALGSRLTASVCL